MSIDGTPLVRNLFKLSLPDNSFSSDSCVKEYRTAQCTDSGSDESGGDEEPDEAIVPPLLNLSGSLLPVNDAMVSNSPTSIKKIQFCVLVQSTDI